MKRIAYHPHVHPAQPWYVFETDFEDVERIPKIALFAARMQQTDSERSPLWCLVGNLRAVTSHGPGGIDKRFGTNSFSPGAKLYCLPLQWG